jgi:CBS domain-containing protein
MSSERSTAMRTDRIAEWMSSPPIVIPATTTLAAAQHVMEQRHVRRLPVVQGKRLIGIVTWGDLRAARPSAATTLSVHEWQALLEQATVAECMSRDPITVAPNATVIEAAQIMLAHKLGGLPVVADSEVVGVITESDLMRLLIAEATGAEQANSPRELLICQHCGTVLRGRSFATIGSDDTCWHCHYHLHRCENCRYFDSVGCMLDRPDRHTAIPGQQCQDFAYRQARAVHAEPLLI